MNPSLREQADQYIDQNYQYFQRLASQLLAAFPLQRGHISTQVRSLQQVAVSATCLADIEDFIKNQVGKEFSKRGDEEKWRAVGRPLLAQLGNLRQVRARTPGGAEEEQASEDDQLRFRLMLAQGRGLHLVSEYLFLDAIPVKEAGGPAR